MIIPIAYLWIAASAVIAYLGRGRKFGFWGYFFASVLLSPLFGALLVIASGASANSGSMNDKQA